MKKGGEIPLRGIALQNAPCLSASLLQRMSMHTKTVIMVHVIDIVGLVGMRTMSCPEIAAAHLDHPKWTRQDFRRSRSASRRATRHCPWFDMGHGRAAGTRWWCWLTRTCTEARGPGGRVVQIHVDIGPRFGRITCTHAQG